MSRKTRSWTSLSPLQRFDVRRTVEILGDIDRQFSDDINDSYTAPEEASALAVLFACMSIGAKQARNGQFFSFDGSKIRPARKR